MIPLEEEILTRRSENHRHLAGYLPDILKTYKTPEKEAKV
jgi:hypothetical protein